MSRWERTQSHVERLSVSEMRFWIDLINSTINVDWNQECEDNLLWFDVSSESQPLGRVDNPRSAQLSELTIRIDVQLSKVENSRSDATQPNNFSRSAIAIEETSSIS